MPFFYSFQVENNNFGEKMLSLEDLPDEITLKILNLVNIKDLFRCLAVNKKLRTIANDQSLWITMHLEGKMPPELLTLTNSCKRVRTSFVIPS